MHQSGSTQANLASSLRVAAGEDRFGEQRGLGISVITLKVVPQDSNGLLVIENSFRARGGPARHLHHTQDEWFYAVEGEFMIEVGQERFSMNPGDSLLAPRQVPHVWAYVGETTGRMLIAFMPAGKMEAFFREVTKDNAMPSQDPKLWQAHGMELLGPPLLVGTTQT
jgi:quercetin dioxygenase-like cupin family protein